MCNWEQFPTNWRAFAHLRLRDQHGGKPRWSSACPIEGGEDRLDIYPEGNPRSQKLRDTPYLVCRSCGMCKFLGEHVVRAGPTPREPDPVPLNPEIALSAHQALTKEARAYFHARGISDVMIARHKLGWAEWGWPHEEGTLRRLNRYSVPCWESGTLWAVQYRQTPDDEARDRAAGRKPTRYLSWPGGNHKKLINTDLLRELAVVPVVFIVEGPLDALALSSIVDRSGRALFPTVAPFQGNSASHAWRKEWTPLIAKAYTRVIIPDNKGKAVDELIALSRQTEVPGSLIHPLPPGFGDVGELIKAEVATAPQRVAEWLKPLLQVRVA